MKSKDLSPEELRARAIRFYDRYGKDLEQIKNLLEIRLTQLALAYTITNKLPAEAIRVTARVKNLNSFLKKLEKKGWPQFYYPTEVVGDLIGARVVCWFLDDCNGFVSLINSSPHLRMDNAVEDYIKLPKPSGYRSIHLISQIAYDGVKRINEREVEVVAQVMRCEVQVRTKLQDAWGDVTHEFHYKAKNAGVDNPNLEDLLSDISNRLANEDATLIKFRDYYQKLADEKLANNTREGFQSASSESGPKYFMSKPFLILQDALAEAQKKALPVFAVIYDAGHSSKSRMEYYLGYFLEYETTKKLVDENFVTALIPVSQGQVRSLVPSNDPLEKCRLIVLRPNGSELASEGLQANPDVGLDRVREIVTAWKEEQGKQA
jgi:putative GTP pyrophosphokinase